MTALLKVNDLSLRFRTRHGSTLALDKVSLTVQRGEIVGIVGESGAGKSVLANAVMRLHGSDEHIDAGSSIVFGGTDMLKATPADLGVIRGRELAMIFRGARAALNPVRRIGLQIEDVLSEHAVVRSDDLKRQAILALRRVRIADPERHYDAYPFELSDGLCQRVMIAMALACTPALLIADEATVGLDITTQAAVMDLIRDISHGNRMATLLITRDLRLAGEYCDRIAVMQAGQLVETAPADQLLREPAHPFTRQLLAATPGPGPGRHGPPPRPAGKTPLIEVRGLTKLYPATGGRKGALLHAVDGVDLAIGRGECVGLVGESGCGKSTLARLAARLVEPSSGSIVFDGRSLTAMLPGLFERSAERARIQAVLQGPTDSLNPSFRVVDSIADPLRRLLGIRHPTELDRRVHRTAELVGLPDDCLPRHPHQLSDEQRVRVGIARALVVEPSLLILDEPVSMLDVSVQASILHLLSSLRARLGMSYLFVSRDLNAARGLCDRIAVMYLGRVVEVAAADTLFTAPAHPYTQALIAALPNPALRGEKRIRLDSEAPMPIDPDPTRCRFHGRCPAGADRCITALPTLRRIGDGHFAACHFA